MIPTSVIAVYILDEMLTREKFVPFYYKKLIDELVGSEFNGYYLSYHKVLALIKEQELLKIRLNG